MNDFENKLIQMSKPEVTQLRHQALLSEQLIKTGHRNAISWWWLGIPLYIVAALLMKSVYAPSSTLHSGLRELLDHNKSLAYVAFILLPVLLIIINVVNIYKLSRFIKSWDIYFLRTIFLNLLIIMLAIIVLIIFLTV